MAITERTQPTPDQTPNSGEQAKPAWYRRRWVQVYGGIATASAVGLTVWGVKVANDVDRALNDLGLDGGGTEVTAPLVPGEDAPAEQPADQDAEAPVPERETINLDWESYFPEPEQIEVGEYDNANEADKKELLNRTLGFQMSKYLSAAVAVIEAGGDPATDIPEEYIATVATSPNNAAFVALNTIAQQIVDGKPAGSNVSRVNFAEVPNDNEGTWDPASGIWVIDDYKGGNIEPHWLAATAGYIPEGGDGGQEVRSEFGVPVSGAAVVETPDRTLAWEVW